MVGILRLGARVKASIDDIMKLTRGSFQFEKEQSCRAEERHPR